MQKEKIKKPRKKYFRPTVARFTTEECKCILKHMTLARSGGLTFDKDWADTKMYYRIKARLEDRIEKEERKNENGGGDQGRTSDSNKVHGDNGSSSDKPSERDNHISGMGSSGA